MKIVFKLIFLSFNTDTKNTVPNPNPNPNPKPNPRAEKRRKIFKKTTSV